jgi:Smg protein
MNENIVELLLYLFENYIYESDDLTLDKKSIQKGLSSAGFDSLTIDNAFNWLDDLKSDVKTFQGLKIKPDSFRIFTASEQLKIDTESIDFIYYLNNSKILDNVQREILINAIMKLETNQFDVDDLHWLALMVLFSQPEQEQAFAHLEALLFDTDDQYEH